MRGSAIALLWAALGAVFLVGCHIGAYRLDSPVDDGEFVGNDRFLVTVSRQRVPRSLALYDLESGKTLWRLSPTRLGGASLSNNGAFAILVEYQPESPKHRLVMLDVRSGRTTSLGVWFEYEESTIHGDEMRRGPEYNHVSDDGNLIAQFVDFELRLLDRGGRVLFRASFPELWDPVVRFQPNSKSLFVSVGQSDKRFLYVLEKTGDGWRLHEPIRASLPTWTSRGLYYLAQGDLRCWCAGKTDRLDTGSRYYTMDVTPDGRFVGSPSDGGYDLYDVDRQRFTTIDLAARDVGTDGTMATVYTKGGDLYRVDLRTRKERQLRSFGPRSRTYRIPIPDMGQGIEDYYHVMVSPDGRYFLYFDDERDATYVYDLGKP